MFVCVHTWVGVCVWLIRSGGQWINGAEYKTVPPLCWCCLLNANFSFSTASWSVISRSELSSGEISSFHCFPLGWSLQKPTLLTSRETTRGRTWIWRFWEGEFVFVNFVSHERRLASPRLTFSLLKAKFVYTAFPSVFMTWQRDVNSLIVVRCSWLSLRFTAAPPESSPANKRDTWLKRYRDNCLKISLMKL